MWINCFNFLFLIIFFHDITLSVTSRDIDLNQRQSLWPQEEEKQLKKNNYNNSHKVKACHKKFVTREGQIIQTQKSIKNGAVFLSVSSINSAAECTNLCCNTNTCTTALFEINKQQCYLFDCSKNDICSYTENVNYMVSRINTSPDSYYSKIKHTIDHEDVETKGQSSKVTAIKQNSLLSQESHPSLLTQSHHHEADSAGSVETASKDDDEEHRFDSKSRQTSSDKSDETEAVLTVGKGGPKKTKKIQVTKTASPADEKLELPVATPASILVKSNNWQSEKMDGLSAEDLRMLANTNSQSRVAIVALGLSLALTGLLLTVVAFRLRSVRSRLRRGGKVLNKDEADYLINGMYL